MKKTECENGNIYILHLSDLHIVAHGAEYGLPLKKLIADISEQLSDYNNIILVVSGDIIDKGNYCEENIKATLEFFTDLKKALENKVVDVEIVPGNHDKERNEINEAIIKSIQHYSTEMNENIWNFLLTSYKGFLDLYNEILKIFAIDKKSPIKNSFGVDSVRIQDKEIIFIRIDTAWGSYSKDDSWNLQVGEYQEKCLVREYRKYIANFNDRSSSNLITIAISHHPLNLLTQQDESNCNNLFLATDQLNVDILLCGHVHKLSLAHYFNHEHSLLTLVTGIGGDDNNEGNHRYSIYSLNLINNSCDIIMRRSGNNQFDYDYSIYTGRKESSYKKLTYPIRVRESHSFIEMTAPEIIKNRRKFLDQNLLDKIPQISIALSDFSRIMSQKNITYINDFMDQVILGENFDGDFSDIYTKLEGYFIYHNDNSGSEKAVNDTIKEYYKSNAFRAFLQELCDVLVDCLEDCFSKDTRIRAHFRVFNKSNGEFKSLCVSNNSKGSEEKKYPQTIKWNNFLKLAYTTKTPIISSANPNLNEVNTDWDDFLTIIPDCTGIDYTFTKEKRNAKFENDKRPWLTFGLSYKSSNKSNSDVFYVLSFLGFQNILKSILDDYIDIFKLNLQDLVKDNMLNNDEVA